MLKLQTKPGQQVWLTSDWHINHRNLCRGTSLWTDKCGCRDFECPADMENVIVSNFNRLVKSDDIVFYLGDLIFGDKTYIHEFINKLSCKNIYFICGNHDDWMHKRQDIQKLFLGFYKKGLEVSINKRLFVLDHYANLVWRDCHLGSIHAYGHSHSSLPDRIDSRSLDVGVDGSLYGHEKFCPYSLDELLFICDNCKKGEFQALDHHGRS